MYNIFTNYCSHFNTSVCFNNNAFSTLHPESAILRPYRRLASLLGPHNIGSDDFGDDKGGSWRYHGGHSYKSRHLISGKFRPNPRRCCQIGERVAQKQMSCDITVLAMLRKYHNDMWLSSQLQSGQTSRDRTWYGPYNYQSKLSEKVAKCSAAQPRHFVKCCVSEDKFLRNVRRCQLMAGSREERRRCRQTYKRRKWK